jgi:hypothetical protein
VGVGAGAPGRCRGGGMCVWLVAASARKRREEATEEGGEVEEWRAGRSPTRCGAKRTGGRKAKRNGSAAARAVGLLCWLAVSRGPAAACARVQRRPPAGACAMPLAIQRCDVNCRVSVSWAKIRGKSWVKSRRT